MGSARPQPGASGEVTPVFYRGRHCPERTGKSSAIGPPATPPTAPSAPIGVVPVPRDGRMSYPSRTFPWSGYHAPIRTRSPLCLRTLAHSVSASSARACSPPTMPANVWRRLMGVPEACGRGCGRSSTRRPSRGSRPRSVPSSWRCWRSLPVSMRRPHGALSRRVPGERVAGAGCAHEISLLATTPTSQGAASNHAAAAHPQAHLPLGRCARSAHCHRNRGLLLWRRSRADFFRCDAHDTHHDHHRRLR